MNKSKEVLIVGSAGVLAILSVGCQQPTVQKDIPTAAPLQSRNTEAQKPLETPVVLVNLREANGHLTYESLQAGFQGPRYKNWGELSGTKLSKEEPLLVGLGNGTQRAFTLVRYPNNMLMLMSGKDQACVLADEHRMELFERLVNEAQKGRKVSSDSILLMMNGALHCKSVLGK